MPKPCKIPRFSHRVRANYASIVEPIELSGVVEVTNRSAQGLGLIVDDADAFYVTQNLELTYDGAFASAVVRHVLRRRDGRFVVTVDCQ